MHAGKKLANTFPISFDADATSCDTEFSFFPVFLSEGGTAVQPGLLFTVYGKMNTCDQFLDNFSALFDRTVTAASRVSAGKRQVSLYRVITYNIVTIL